MYCENDSATIQYMPSDAEKKEIPVTMKLSESQLTRLENICSRHDRPRSYVARELMLRGLALYDADGRIRDGELREPHFEDIPARELHVTRPKRRKTG